MCLDSVAKLTDEIPKNGTGWKVVVETDNPNVHETLYTNFLLPTNTWLTSKKLEDSGTKRWAMPIVPKYPIGFHLFNTYKDAVNYLNGNTGNNLTCPRWIVVTCSYKNATHVGNTHAIFSFIAKSVKLDIKFE